MSQPGVIVVLDTATVEDAWEVAKAMGDALRSMHAQLTFSLLSTTVTADLARADSRVIDATPEREEVDALPSLEVGQANIKSRRDLNAASLCPVCPECGARGSDHHKVDCRIKVYLARVKLWDAAT